MLARTGFPEYVESLAIGPSPDFLRTQTDDCGELADAFPTEVNAAYLWKKIATSFDPLEELREFTKHFLVDAPDFSEEYILHYVKKVNMLPPDLRNQIQGEVEAALEKAASIIPKAPYDPTGSTADDIKKRNFDKTRALQDDPSLLDKLSNMMDSCKPSCNYFAPITDKVGAIFDFSRMNSLNSSMPQDSELNAPPPTGLGLNIMNKIPRAVQDALMEAYTSAKLLMDAAKEQLTSPGTTAKLREFAKQGISADRKGVPFIGSTGSSLFQDALGLNSNLMTKIKRNMGDCFRLADFLNRYNAFDEDMNLAVARKKVFKLKIPDASLGGEMRTWSGTAQGVSSSDAPGGDPYSNNITPQAAIKPQTTGDARKHDDTVKPSAPCPEDTPMGQSPPKPASQTPTSTAPGGPATGTPVPANDPNAPWLTPTGPQSGTSLPKLLPKAGSPMTVYGAFDDERTPDLNSIVGLGNTGLLEPGDVGLGSEKKAQIEAAIGKKLRPGDQFYLNGTKFRYADRGDEKSSEVRKRIDLYAPPGSRDATVKFMNEYNRRTQPDVISYAGYRPIDRGQDLQAWTKRPDVKAAWNAQLAANAKIGRTRYGGRSVYLNKGVTYQGIVQKLPGYENTRLARK